jgi:hypothetical protein
VKHEPSTPHKNQKRKKGGTRDDETKTTQQQNIDMQQKD